MSAILRPFAVSLGVAALLVLPMACAAGSGSPSARVLAPSCLVVVQAAPGAYPAPVEARCAAWNLAQAAARGWK